MAGNKTMPTDVKVDDFLKTTSEKRMAEAKQIIEISQSICGEEPVMWGPSIIGFGKQHYKYETSREGDMPKLGFSPRKSAITMYFSEGFQNYGDELKKLGKYKNSVSCLYINKLDDVDMGVLKTMLKKSYELNNSDIKKAQSVDDYVASVPDASVKYFNRLRDLARQQLPDAKEVLSYGIVGYKIDDKRARVFISGWKEHVAMYPIPKSESLREQLAPYIKGKGTLWFPLNKPLPEKLIIKTIQALTEP